jgi:hypothetical protein
MSVEIAVVKGITISFQTVNASFGTFGGTFLVLTHCVFSEIAAPFAIERRSN